MKNLDGLGPELDENLLAQVSGGMFKVSYWPSGETVTDYYSDYEPWCS
ncbi:hypothetical protein [Nonomuraea sp. NPDC050310]